MNKAAKQKSPEIKRFSKLANKKYLELLGEKKEKRLAAYVAYKKILDSVPFKGKLSPKPVRVWVNIEAGKCRAFYILKKERVCA